MLKLRRDELVTIIGYRNFCLKIFVLVKRLPQLNKAGKAHTFFENGDQM
jgi:hypothetical protein